MPNLLQEEEKGCGRTRRFGEPSQWGAGEAALAANRLRGAGEAALAANRLRGTGEVLLSATREEQSALCKRSTPLRAE
ncbi:MAG: hypothetical protein JSR93_05070 [Verrucomicrobia bacterium]|nr:hypothetical protein [Verrucomicrobiota bacterium]